MQFKNISKQEEFDDIIARCQICHVSMVDDKGMPYVVPMNFGYRDGIVYLHSAREGKKIRLLKENPGVCLAFSTDYLLRYQNENVACSYSMKYRSVLIYGKVEFVEDADAKTEALHIFMKQYSGREFTYNMPAIREVCIWKVIPEEVTGRIYGY